ncbi:sulfatase family protein [Nocardioides marmoribigeumensis]|uniref:Arylsulfatase A-like enzyme n=1 Tax=Nocardioides marmoribigeumensis TaxID=433649 RepID=A0ABU2BZ56_9ACTN|nr:sulfatase [Nocardioides marmoribigeumensis]MDR7363688.1 arylsulfatase A-like enzyme [Nocardioides marmoribigeumensis]
MIMTDDMRDDDLRFMPLTRRLVGGAGVRFRNSFSPYPLCCPARASVLTGRYTHNHRVLDVEPPWGFPSFDDRSTIATWLNRAGYATVYLGKYLNGYGKWPAPRSSGGRSLHYVPPGWSDWRASFDGGFRRGSRYDGGTYRYFDTTLSADGRGFTPYPGRYQSRVYGDLSERIIRSRARSDRPFFLYVSYSAPHHGLPDEPDDPRPVRRVDGQVSRFPTPARPDGVKGRFDARVREAPGASWSDPDFSDKPGYLRKPPLNRAEKRALLEVTRQRAEALAVVDQQVGRTIRALRVSGELGRTLVVFTSDNGFFLGEQRIREGKVLPHEPSLRTPLLVRGPGIPRGEVRRDPFMSVDFAPTIAAAARVTPPTWTDGVSMLGVARHGDSGWQRGVLTETGPRGTVRRSTDWSGEPLTDGGDRDLRYLIGLRTSRYLYVDVATGSKELYDVVADPREYVNLARDPSYAGLMASFAEQLKGLRSCRGAACRTPLPDELSAPPAS